MCHLRNSNDSMNALPFLRVALCRGVRRDSDELHVAGEAPGPVDHIAVGRDGDLLSVRPFTVMSLASSNFVSTPRRMSLPI